MKKWKPWLIYLVSTSALFTSNPIHADDSNDQKIELARKHLNQLRAGEFKAFSEASTDQMREALPPEQLEAAWKGITDAYGAFVKEIAVDTTERGEFFVATLTCEFEKTNLDITITLDRSNKVAGLFFKPAEAKAPYSPPDYVDSEKFEETDVTITADEKFPLPATLSIPKLEKKVPAVVLVHGSGPHDRDSTIYQNKPFKDLAGGLASRGIAVLRYEKRTHKYGANLDPKKINIDSETADDAIAAAKLLREHDRIDSRHVYVLGHSLGATAAPYIASRDKKIAGIIMLAGAARPIHELVEEQIRYIANVDGKVTAEEQIKIDETAEAVKKIRTGTWRADDMLLGAPSAYWASLTQMAPVENAKKLSRPILILQGGRDYQVTNEDLKIWKKELANRPNVEIVKFEKLDHLFRSGDGPSTPDDYLKQGYVDREVVSKIASWIESQIAKQKAAD